jgi:hypothetical protein
MEGKMSLPKKSYFRLSLILPLVILFIFVLTVQKQGESAVQEGRKSWTLKELQKGFDDYLDGFFGQLSSHFKERNFEDMAELLANSTVLYTPQGKRITTKGEFLKFFMGEWRPEVIDLKFKVVCSEVFEVADPIEKGQETIDAIGHAIFTYHIIKKTGETISNQEGSGGHGAEHPSSCIWGTP